MAEAPIAITVPLSKPLATHKGDVNELSLREPTARDYIQLGLPVRQIKTADGTEQRMDMPNMARWASRLSGIEQGIIETLNKEDWWVLVRAISAIIGASEDDDDEKTLKN